MRLLWTGFLLAVSPLLAQSELGLTFGSISGPFRITPTGTRLTLSTGTAFQANYARHMRTYRFGHLYGEMHVLASPRQSVTSTVVNATHRFASFYATPGVRVKFYPKNRLSPWVVGGGGYALYMQSPKTISGAVNAAPRTRSSGAIEIGGGLDWVWNRKMSLRMEARDFYTGSPKYNVALDGPGQFNFIFGVGVVFNLGVK